MLGRDGQDYCQAGKEGWLFPPKTPRLTLNLRGKEGKENRAGPGNRMDWDGGGVWKFIL